MEDQQKTALENAPAPDEQELTNRELENAPVLDEQELTNKELDEVSGGSGGSGGGPLTPHH